jgi:pyridoxamine 5'-phosphate oxidase
MSDKNDLQGIRIEYQKGRIDLQDVDKNPFNQFTLWMNEALKSEVMEPTAMALATVGKDMRPSNRMVLLKGFDTDGFVFYTSYDSKKGLQIAENNFVALTFFWKELERQVRIEGAAMKLSEEVSDRYFYSRPYESRLSAAASPQSKPIRNREVMERVREGLKERFPDNDIPRPANWGGYIVKPSLLEFWQGRSSRLHDRIVYELSEVGEWKISRLAP